MNNSLIAVFGIYWMVALVVTSIGFKKVVWFISLGYTLSIIALVLVTTLFYRPSYSFYNYLQQIGLFIWGLRLGFYLFKREKKESYKEGIKSVTNKSQALPLAVKGSIWVSVSLLYVCMFAPALLAVTMKEAPTYHVYLVITGIILLYVGIIIESIADEQKSNYKLHNPKKICNTGLYAWVRYPNYFGEMLVWVGNFMIGIFFYQTWWHWTIALFGLICIILIMIGSAKRLELKQNESYFSDPSYQHFIASVPVLFPWIPMYSLKGWKIKMG